MEVLRSEEAELLSPQLRARADVVSPIDDSHLSQSSKTTKLTPSGVPESTLSYRVRTEGDGGIAYGMSHKMWAMLELESMRRNDMNYSRFACPIDFVVAIDRSASMHSNKKLAYVKATIEYLLSKLESHHRFCLLVFNHQVQHVTPGLVPMTNENKLSLLERLHQIRAEGSTNIHDALHSAASIFKNRLDSELNRIGSILLFTDGLATHGHKGAKLTSALQSFGCPQGVIIHTFGYGLDHDSKLLQRIAFCSEGGVYYYVEDTDNIPTTFGECVAGILHTIAHNIQIRIQGQDGCRIVNFYTKFPTSEAVKVKDYTISLGSVYREEKRTILFKLSLRGLTKPVPEHNLVKLTLKYVNTLSGKLQETSTMLSVARPTQTPPQTIPAELDKHINRFAAAAAIEVAISKAKEQDFYAAQQQLQEVINSVQNSISANDQDLSGYCEDLIQDLRDVASGMENDQSFQAGIHYAHAYSTMYFMERSVGSVNMQVGKKLQRKRHQGYGYSTTDQIEQGQWAKEEAHRYVCGYLDDS